MHKNPLATQATHQTGVAVASSLPNISQTIQSDLYGSFGSAAATSSASYGANMRQMQLQQQALQQQHMLQQQQIFQQQQNQSDVNSFGVVSGAIIGSINN